MSHKCVLQIENVAICERNLGHFEVVCKTNLDGAVKTTDRDNNDGNVWFCRADGLESFGDVFGNIGLLNCSPVKIEVWPDVSVKCSFRSERLTSQWIVGKTTTRQRYNLIESFIMSIYKYLKVN